MTAEIGLFLGFASMFYGRLFFIGCTRVCLAVYGIVHLVIVFDICACVCGGDIHDGGDGIRP